MSGPPIGDLLVVLSMHTYHILFSSLVLLVSHITTDPPPVEELLVVLNKHTYHIPFNPKEILRDAVALVVAVLLWRGLSNKLSRRK